ncbi:MAG TPA: O-antigen ligase family protein [Candidatus Polarisedimenticolia bacterium]|nr:O-antigen ligase family protein [Candidatus Polarisedimenticolia bacterium]
MSGHPRLIGIAARLYFLCVAALIPIIRPAMPANTAIFDYPNLAFMGLSGLYLLFYRKLTFRLLAPLGVIVFASLAATVNSEHVSTNMMTLAQELYLFAFLTVLFNMIESEADMLFLLRCWFLMAAVEGVMLLSELTANVAVRARGTFENPNMASSYLGVSVFLVVVPRIVPGMALRLLVFAPILLGVIATKSMSALLGVCAGGAVLAAIHWTRATAKERRRLAAAGGLTVAAAAVVLPGVLSTHNYANRLDDSAGGRNLIWEAGMESFLHNPLGVGIGPAGFQYTKVISGGPFKGTTRKELHSDYLSFLVERGVFGFLGLLMFLGSIALMLWRCLTAARDRPSLFMAMALSGMFLFSCIDALSHEVLHYRHVWLALALAVAQERLVRLAVVSRAKAAWRAAPGAAPAA